MNLLDLDELPVAKINYGFIVVKDFVYVMGG
jgi:hypothetical protein